MQPPRTRVAAIRTAERSGRDRPSEDRIFTTANAVILLDGASQPDASNHDGGWYADTLGHELHQRLSAEPHGDLAALLADAIAVVAERHELTPGAAPSATVSIVRWDEHAVDVLVLGDSPVTALTRSGTIHLVRDDRLKGVGLAQRQQLAASAGFGFDDHDQWRRLVDAERAQRNQPGGYWIGEAAPEAASHAYRARWDRDDLVAVLVMTDGVSVGVDRYGVPPDWPSAFTLTQDDPARLVELVHDTEATDPDGLRWPRSKRHDDKAVAFIRFRAASTTLQTW
ncbi:protein phosphatase 2C domain-containing protein [Polymorphospora rubra]|uniref:PPM-type phosphatase domain-containing protein n=1 Tax=Polymorphospora rubra TaxID=338584 RepID=A0A810MYS3_9ACTN|nr:protein phosphatase 2C domain-containing protein [Polymorphospora rubra]BCJ66252.1 hypothetical protein Prubr_32730 [Polymorphospora rubra]